MCKVHVQQYYRYIKLFQKQSTEVCQPRTFVPFLIQIVCCQYLSPEVNHKRLSFAVPRLTFAECSLT